MHKEMKKIIKNIKIIAITMLCMITMLNGTVYAAEGTVFQVKGQEGKAGEMVTVPIEMHSGEDVGGFELTVYYDKDTLEFESLSKGNLIISDESNGLFDYNHKADNASIKIVYVVADTIKADGVIANIKFKLKKDCGEELPIGMGIEQVVDNSASSNEISGEVSGVNADFQKQIDSQNGTTTEVADSSSATEQQAGAEVDNTDNAKIDGTQDTASAEDNKKESKDTAAKNKNAGADDKEEKDKKAVKKETKAADNNKNVRITVVIAGVIVITGIAAILIKKKKKKR
nr:cohesin domain-containing protein [uncultured Mediterraneibacter sp.]